MLAFSLLRATGAAALGRFETPHIQKQILVAGSKTGPSMVGDVVSPPGHFVDLWGIFPRL